MRTRSGAGSLTLYRIAWDHYYILTMTERCVVQYHPPPWLSPLLIHSVAGLFLVTPLKVANHFSDSGKERDRRVGVIIDRNIYTLPNTWYIHVYTYINNTGTGQLCTDSSQLSSTPVQQTNAKSYTMGMSRIETRERVLLDWHRLPAVPTLRKRDG